MNVDSKIKQQDMRHCVRVVKEIDQKSIGFIPRRFESCQCRKYSFYLFIHILHTHTTQFISNIFTLYPTITISLFILSLLHKLFSFFFVETAKFIYYYHLYLLYARFSCFSKKILDRLRKLQKLPIFIENISFHICSNLDF